MKISIIGLGWFGESLGEYLKEMGHVIQGTTRTTEKQKSLNLRFKTYLLGSGDAIDPALLETDLIVLNIPPFKNQLEWFKSWKLRTNVPIIFISSISVETNPNKENARILQEEENWVQSHFNKVTVLRFGGLIGKERHPGKHLSGKKNLTGGNERVRILYLEDAIKFTIEVIQNERTGIFTVLSPENRSKKEFYSDYCRKQGLPLPEYI